MRRRLINETPCVDLAVPAEEPHQPQYLSPERVKLLADNAHGGGKDRRAESRLDGRYGPMIWLVAITTPRINEMSRADRRLHHPVQSERQDPLAGTDSVGDSER